MKKVAVSGYFNPLHSGHISFLEEAKKLGDYLIVIINNDEQVNIKKSIPFMNVNERSIIISSLKFVDEVVISIDKDNTVCETLKSIKPDIFANGGDRNYDNIPETKICKEYDIEMIFGVGNKKIQSSSKLIKSVIDSNITIRNWGYYKVLSKGKGWKLKLIEILPKQKSSLQRHKYRNEEWIVLNGELEVLFGMFFDRIYLRTFREKDKIIICKNKIHQFINNTNFPVSFFEISWGDIIEEEDIERFNEEYIKNIWRMR